MGQQQHSNSVVVADIAQQQNVKQLFDAIHEKDYEKVKSLIEKDPNIVNARGQFGYTPLHEAGFVRNPDGVLQIVKLLLESGADVNLKDSNGWTSLHEFASRGNSQCLTLLLDYKADVHAVNADGKTAFQIATSPFTRYKTPLSATEYNHKLKCAELLLDRGSNINAVDTNRKTALHEAASQVYKLDSPQPNPAYFLLKNGADVKIVDNKGKTALHEAVLSGRSYLIEALIKHGVDVNIFDHDGKTALHIAASKGNPLCIELLLKNGADVNIFDHDGKTALHIAAFRFNDQCIDVLLKNGADVNKVNKYGETALHIAASTGNPLCIELLLKNGADFNLVDNDGKTALDYILQRTPLNEALVTNSTECAKILIDNGADFNIVDRYGRAALHIAASTGNPLCIELLLKNGADVNKVNKYGETALHAAASKGNLECAKFLIDNGADVTLVNIDNQTAADIVASQGNLPFLNLFSVDTSGKLIEKCQKVQQQNILSEQVKQLFDAIHEKDYEKVKSLIEKDPNIVNARGQFGYTPLQEAGFVQNPDGVLQIVKLLLESGADVNLKDSNGWTSLHEFASRGNSECLTLLLDYKADVHAVNADGKTAFQIATSPFTRYKTPLSATEYNHKLKCAELLLDRGSDINAVKNGKTALHIATSRCYDQCINLLLKSGATNNDEKNPLDDAQSKTDTDEDPGQKTMATEANTVLLAGEDVSVSVS